MENKSSDTINKLFDFHNCVSSLGEEWYDQSIYEYQKNNLLEMKDFATKHRDEIFNRFGYLVDDIYSQLEEFEYFIPILQADTITDTREEAIILTALHYILIGKKIISPHIRLTSKRQPPDYKRQEFERYCSKFKATRNLILFYLWKKKNPDCAKRLDDLIFEYLDLSIELIKEYPNEKDNFNPTDIAIDVLKKLIREKNLSLAKQILEGYKLKPRGSEIKTLVKIKEKIYKE